MNATRFGTKNINDPENIFGIKEHYQDVGSLDIDDAYINSGFTLSDKHKYALLAEDKSRKEPVDGGKIDIILAYSNDKSKLLLWAACNGIDIKSKRATPTLRRVVYYL